MGEQIKYVIREPYDDDVSGCSDNWTVVMIVDDASGQRRNHWLSEFVERGDAELFVAARNTRPASPVVSAPAPSPAKAEAPSVEELLTARIAHLERTSKLLDRAGQLEHWNRICECNHLLAALQAQGISTAEGGG